MSAIHPYDMVSSFKKTGLWFKELICAFCLLIILTSASFVNAQSVLNRDLTLEEVIKIALAKNPSLDEIRNFVDASKIGIAIAKGKHFGRIDLFASNLYAGFDDVNKKRLIPRTQLFPERSNDDIFGRNITTAGISYRLPIYTGGRLTAQVELSQFAAEASKFKLQQTTHDLFLNLTNVFYTILRIEKDIEATESSIKALRESKRILSRAVEVGQRPKLDLLKVNTRFALVRQKFVRLRSNKAIAKGVLATLMGMDDITQEFNLAGRLDYLPFRSKLKVSIREALRKRPAYEFVKREIAIAERKVRIARSKRLPQVSLGLIYKGANNDEKFRTVQDDFTAVLQVQIPLYAGGVLVNQVSQERARLAQAKSKLIRLRFSIAQEVQKAYFRVKAAEERIFLSKEVLKEASEALKIEALKLKIGKGIVEDLLLAQEAELKARANHFSALADAKISLASFFRAVGITRSFSERR